MMTYDDHYQHYAPEANPTKKKVLAEHLARVSSIMSDGQFILIVSLVLGLCLLAVAMLSMIGKPA